MKKRLIKIDLSKNQKLAYYINRVSYFLAPKFFYKWRSKKIEAIASNLANEKSIIDRVNYYNKINDPYVVDDDFESINTFLKSRKRTYYFDFFHAASLFDFNSKVSYLFGDVTKIPPNPTFVKSRPIAGANENSVLLKLDTVRHFIFVNDELAFEDKKDMAVWRGGVYREHRRVLMRQLISHEMFDIGETNKKNANLEWKKERMSLKEQLQYKFLLSVEGNDVASNLKWAMSANSVVLMTKPKFETWFMEGTLIENYHYVLVKDDYSDAEEKMKYYIEHPEEAKQIIANAHAYIEQFRNEEQEAAVAHLVLKKYFAKQLKN